MAKLKFPKFIVLDTEVVFNTLRNKSRHLERLDADYEGLVDEVLKDIRFKETAIEYLELHRVRLEEEGRGTPLEGDNVILGSMIVLLGKAIFEQLIEHEVYCLGQLHYHFVGWLNNYLPYRYLAVLMVDNNREGTDPAQPPQSSPEKVLTNEEDTVPWEEK